MIHYAATADKIFELMYGDAGAIPTSDSGGQTIELDTVKKRLEILLGKFEEIQGVSLMQARKAMKRENEKAVQKGDTSYFRSRYPDFSLW